MALHLIKLCVGTGDIGELADWQEKNRTLERKIGGRAAVYHTTFQMPKRREELLDGGSLYWVMKGTIAARQRLLGLDEGLKPDGSPCCLLLLDRHIIPVRPAPRRAFQGWRYFKAEEAPADLGAGAGGIAKMPPKLRRDLSDLGLI